MACGDPCGGVIKHHRFAADLLKRQILRLGLRPGAIGA